MRFLVRLEPFSDARHSTLEKVIESAEQIDSSVKSPRWTSKGVLEVDLFAPDIHAFDAFLRTLPRFSTLLSTRDLGAPFTPSRPGPAIAEAKALFNDERFWEAHEMLESAWRGLAGDEKLLVQGIILTCAAFVHVQKEETTVARGLFEKAAKQLLWKSDNYHGIDLAAMREAVVSRALGADPSPFTI